MNRVSTSIFNGLRRAPMLRRSGAPLRNLEDKIKDREMALEDSYVKQMEMDRIRAMSDKNKKTVISTTPKKRKGKKDHNKTDPLPVGRVTDSGFIF
ncbi:hypothetical protein CYY_005860 [Polysphondylium violaceum]|uniref:Uncharacterized protein n=1 Tax=Polysphondylium violaceum TaxID=133409 RepID=A0A8J4PST9_9MYCE|nr:hypothetical protein CYY_005860 [Polysphondylium violaceum]